MKHFWWSLFLSLTTYSVTANAREIAITIDDLPFVGVNSNDMGVAPHTQSRFMHLVQSLIDYQVPATGFVIAGSIGKGQWQLLEEFRKDGFDLGNHTYSHANLDRMSTNEYIEEIARADKILTPIMTQPKYFRYPYLAEGKGQAKQKVQDYLVANQYVVAPVTIDSKDYKFNERLLHIPYRERPNHLAHIRRQYLDYIWQQTVRAEKIARSGDKQILLIHANLLNSYFLGDILAMYKQNGYRFISLNEALASQPASVIQTTSLPSVSIDGEKHDETLNWPQMEKVW